MSPCVCTYMWVFTWLYHQGIGSEVSLEVRGGTEPIEFPSRKLLGQQRLWNYVIRNGELIERGAQRWKSRSFPHPTNKFVTLMNTVFNWLHMG